jgi:hypothetical protein
MSTERTKFVVNGPVGRNAPVVAQAEEAAANRSAAAKAQKTRCFDMTISSVFSTETCFEK